MNIEQELEAVLFWKGEAVSTKWLAKSLGKTEDEIIAGLQNLENDLLNRGIRLVRFENEVTIGTAAKASELINRLAKEELSRDLGKAGLETLSIILYRGPLPRREIDYIRGVNSQFIVRNLLVRGLIEKVPNPKDERSFLYKPTLELLAHLGIAKIEELPEYERVRKEITDWKQTEEKIENGGTTNPTETTGNSN